MTRIRLATAFGLLTALAVVLGCGKKPEPNVAIDPNSESTQGQDLEPAPEPAPDSDTQARLELIRRWRWIAAAVNDYGAINGEFPAGIVGPGNKLGLSWRVEVLPYLGHEELYRQFKLDEAWDSEHNKKLIEKMPKVFESPKNPAPPGKTYLRAFTGSGFVFSAHPLSTNNRPKLPPGSFVNGYRRTSITDGTVNTMMAVEAAEPSEWTKPDDFPFHLNYGKPDQLTIPKIGGVFDGGFHALNVYGEVLFLPANTKTEDLRAFISIAGRDKVSAEFSNLYAKNPPKPWQRVAARVPAELPDAANRKTAIRNYRAILKGLHAYASQHDQRSPGGILAQKGVGLSWRVQLLPFIGEEALYNQFKLAEPWDSEANKPLLEKMPAVFESPGKPAPKGHTFVRTLQGADGLLSTGRNPGETPPGAKPGSLIHGGCIFSQLEAVEFDGGPKIYLIESSATPWTKPDELRMPAADFKGEYVFAQPPPLGGVFDGGAHAIMSDGRITFYKDGYPRTHLMRMLVGGFSAPIDPLSSQP